MLHQLHQRISNSDRFNIQKHMYGREIKYISARLNEPLFGIQVMDNRLRVNSQIRSELKQP